MPETFDPSETEMLALLCEGASVLVGAGEIDASEAEDMIDWLGEPS